MAIKLLYNEVKQIKAEAYEDCIMFSKDFAQKCMEEAIGNFLNTLHILLEYGAISENVCKTLENMVKVVYVQLFDGEKYWYIGF